MKLENEKYQHFVFVFVFLTSFCLSEGERKDSKKKMALLKWAKHDQNKRTAETNQFSDVL